MRQRVDVLKHLIYEQKNPRPVGTRKS
jgi:hypothetical protein